MTQRSEEWYVAMATAIKKREHAENGVKRWQAQVVQAEREIRELSGNDFPPEAVEQVAEQAAE
jgi:hypothetical protein